VLASSTAVSLNTSSIQAEKLLNIAVSVAGSVASSMIGSDMKPFAAEASGVSRLHLVVYSATAAAPLAGAGCFLGDICSYTSSAVQVERRERKKFAKMK